MFGFDIALFIHRRSTLGVTEVWPSSENPDARIAFPPLVSHPPGDFAQHKYQSFFSCSNVHETIGNVGNREVVAEAGIEPATQGFSVLCSTN
jgi:hypothetical protein